MEESLLSTLRALNIVTQENVTLKHAGQGRYINIKKAYGDISARRLICNAFENICDLASATCLVGAGHGGITPASILADRYNKHLTLVREQPKDHGFTGVIDGYAPLEHDSLCIFDDVYTTGKSLQRVIDILQPTGATILGCYVVVVRKKPQAFSVPLHHIFTLEDFLNNK